MSNEAIRAFASQLGYMQNINFDNCGIPENPCCNNACGGACSNEKR